MNMMIFEELKLTQEWDKTFPKSDKVNRRKATFRNHFGITLAADLYEPKNATGKLPAIAVSGPFGACKEQSSGLCAQTMAERGARDAGNDVELVSLKDKDIRFCKGCLACQKTGRRGIGDDAAEIVGKVQNADVLVFVTPIYYYELSGHLKTLLDRCNPLFPQEYAFRDVYLMNTDAGDVILYQGRQFVIYYDRNSYSLTPLGRITGMAKAELQALLGAGNVTATLSLALK